MMRDRPGKCVGGAEDCPLARFGSGKMGKLVELGRWRVDGGLCNAVLQCEPPSSSS